MPIAERRPYRPQTVQIDLPIPPTIRPKKTEEKIQQIPDKTQRKDPAMTKQHRQAWEKEPDLLKEKDQRKNTFLTKRKGFAKKKAMYTVMCM